MNLRHLQYLRLVIEQGSFAAAAQAGGVTQPAISHGMRQLQQQFAEPLFVRTGRQQRPTEAALRLAREGALLEQQVHALTASRKAAVSRDVLRAGMTPSAALVCGPALYSAWCGGHPHRRLDMRSEDEGRMLAELQAGHLDLVLAPRPRGFLAAGLACEPLYRLAPLAYVRRAHPLVAARSLAELGLAQWAIVGPSVRGPVNVLREAFAVRRLAPPRVAASCPDFSSLVQLLTQSDLIGVIPHPALLSAVPAGQLVPLRLRESLPTYEMHLFTPVRVRRAAAPVVAGLKQALASSSAQDPHQPAMR